MGAEKKYCVTTGNGRARRMQATVGAIALLTAMATALWAGSAGAASLSFMLDQANSLPDGRDYVGVEIADGADGAIDFRVTPQAILTGSARRGFGVKLFAFNVGEGSDADAGNITGLPDGWRAFNNKRADGFGRFDILVLGAGWARQDELTFSVTGISGDAPGDYAEPSTGRARQGNEFFATYVKGFKMREPGHGHGDWDDDSWEMDAFAELQGTIFAEMGNMTTVGGFLALPDDCWNAGTAFAMVKFLKLKLELLRLLWHPNHNRLVRASYFGGSMAVIPLPAGAVLLLSAVASLFGVRRWSTVQS